MSKNQQVLCGNKLKTTAITRRQRRKKKKKKIICTDCFCPIAFIEQIWQLSDFPRVKCTAAATLAAVQYRSQSGPAMLARCQKFPEKCNTKKKAVILNCFCICEEQLGWNLIKTKQKQLSEPKGYFLAVFKRLLKKKSYSLTLFFF